MPEGVTVKTQLLFNIKADGTFKVRFVVRGDLTTKGVHYLQGKSNMASLEGVRMTVSFAAAEGWDLNKIDFTQAFIYAPQKNPHLYCELPLLPSDLKGSRLGSGKSSTRVGHMKRNLYGLVDAGRTFQEFLIEWMINELGARLYINDRNIFEWSFGGETMRGAIHVDDVLYTSSGPVVRREFLRRIRERFKITGDEEDVEDFCGMEIRRDRAAKTITMHQEKFGRKMMDKYDVWGERTETVPYNVSGPELVRFTGEATEREQFDYCMAIGDLLWYSRTNPGLMWRAHDLAQFMQCPGPDHVVAAKRAFRYILGRLGKGITYHGSDEVLKYPYDHRNKIILSTDASFYHAGALATSGAAAFMNGGAIACKVRRQTTTSNTTAEAEVKACSVGMEMILALTDLHGEMTHVQHGTVRTIIDSVGAKAQVEIGMDNKVCASYKRAQVFCEDMVGRGLVWLDRVDGEFNPSDVLTKQMKNVEDFENKAAFLCGERPYQHESAELHRIIESAARP